MWRLARYLPVTVAHELVQKPSRLFRSSCNPGFQVQEEFQHTGIRLDELDEITSVIGSYGHQQ